MPSSLMSLQPILEGDVVSALVTEAHAYSILQAAGSITKGTILNSTLSPSKFAVTKPC
jgi:hypothetical protein